MFKGRRSEFCLLCGMGAGCAAGAKLLRPGPESGKGTVDPKLPGCSKCPACSVQEAQSRSTPAGAPVPNFLASCAGRY